MVRQHHKDARDRLAKAHARQMMRAKLADIKAEEALERKSLKSGVPISVLKEVFKRGYQQTEKHTTHQSAFHRVDSYINGGQAAYDDDDLDEGLEIGTHELRRQYAAVHRRVRQSSGSDLPARCLAPGSRPRR